MSEIHIFTESSENKGILFESYKFLNKRITIFLDLLENTITKIKDDPTTEEIDLTNDITQFKKDIDVEFVPSSIIISEIGKLKYEIKKFKSEAEDILSRYSKLRYRITAGGNYIHGIITRSSLYSKDINSEHYEKINNNIRMIFRSLDWVEKILIDLFNMIDQDLNLITIVNVTYNKKHIFEDKEFTELYDLSNIPDILYHSSPIKIDTKTISVESERGLFLSPYIGISSIFLIDRHKEARKYFSDILAEEDKVIIGSSLNLCYDEWFLPDDKLLTPLKKVHIHHNVPDITEIKTGKSTGYIYLIDVSEIKNELKLFTTNDANREVIYTGNKELPIKEVIQHTIDWEISYKPDPYGRIGKIYSKHFTESSIYFENTFDQYDPPLSYDELPEHLKNDEVHVWRAKHGIELIHKEPSFDEVERIWKNWNLMSKEQKIISDNESIRLFRMNNKTHYENLCIEFQENFYSIKSIEELLKWMDDISYGWFSNKDRKMYKGDDGDEYDFYNYYFLQSPWELMKSKYGVCWDQVEIERIWFEENKIKFITVYIEINDKQGCPSHTFLVYKNANKIYWFEHSWGNYKGIHEYDSLSKLIKDVIKKHQTQNNDFTSPVILKTYEQPEYGISCDEFMSHCRKSNNIDLNSDYLFESVNESKKMIYECGIHHGDGITGDNLEWIREYLAVEGEEFYNKDSVNSLITESGRNGNSRRYLYNEFISYAKNINKKNKFSTVYDNDTFTKSYPFIPYTMRFFYRVANPVLCVLKDKLTFFQLSELEKINSEYNKLKDMIIFAGTLNDMRVFNIQDKKVYLGIEENNSLTLKEILADNFDLYIQKLIGRDDII